MTMQDDDHSYHREREQQCRAMAELANDSEVRRRHEELASLHASRAALYDACPYRCRARRSGRRSTELESSHRPGVDRG